MRKNIISKLVAFAGAVASERLPRRRAHRRHGDGNRHGHRHRHRDGRWLGQRHRHGDWRGHRRWHRHDHAQARPEPGGAPDRLRPGAAHGGGQAGRRAADARRAGGGHRRDQLRRADRQVPRRSALRAADQVVLQRHDEDGRHAQGRRSARPRSTSASTPRRPSPPSWWSRISRSPTCSPRRPTPARRCRPTAPPSPTRACAVANGLTTAGVLTDPGAMAQFYSNMAFRRVRWVQETFVCTKFPAEYSATPVAMGNGQFTSPWPFTSITGGTGARRSTSRTPRRSSAPTATRR